jgi:hypothetical protein
MGILGILWDWTIGPLFWLGSLVVVLIAMIAISISAVAWSKRAVTIARLQFVVWRAQFRVWTNKFVLWRDTFDTELQEMIEPENDAVEPENDAVEPENDAVELESDAVLLERDAVEPENNAVEPADSAPVVPGQIAGERDRWLKQQRTRLMQLVKRVPLMKLVARSHRHHPWLTTMTAVLMAWAVGFGVENLVQPAAGRVFVTIAVGLAVITVVQLLIAMLVGMRNLYLSRKNKKTAFVIVVMIKESWKRLDRWTLVRLVIFLVILWGVGWVTQELVHLLIWVPIHSARLWWDNSTR